VTAPEWSVRPTDVLGNLRSLGNPLSRLLGGWGWHRDVELEPADGGWRVIARLPGVAPEEVAVEIGDGELLIRARSEAEVNADHGLPGTGSSERSFEYQIRLPSEVDAANADAVMDHGLLTVTLPKGTPGRRSITVGRPAYDSTRRVAAAQRRRTTASTPPGRRMTSSGIDPAIDREMHHPRASQARVPRDDL